MSFPFESLTPNQIQGLERRIVLGHNKAVTNAQLTDLTDFGENFISRPSVNTLMEVVSDDAADGPAGNGARKIRIHGLEEVDGKWIEKTQDVTLNGLTAVDEDDNSNPISFIRINAVHVIPPQPTNANHVAIGTISVRDLSDTPVYGKIEAGGNMELACRVTIPDGFNAYVVGWNSSSGKLPNNGDEMDIRLRATCDPDTRELLDGVFLFQDVTHLALASSERKFIPVLKFPPKCEIKASAILNGGSGSGVASASFQYFLIPLKSS